MMCSGMTVPLLKEKMKNRGAMKQEIAFLLLIYENGALGPVMLL